jgi:hypothetical protein
MVSRRIGVMNSVVGKRRDAVMRNGDLKMNAAGKRIEGLQIKSGCVLRIAAVWRSIGAWMKIIVGRRPASLSVWPAKGRWQTSGAMKMKLMRVIVGHIELRCCLATLLMGKIFTDLLM